MTVERWLWRHPSEDPPLNLGDVHVWRVRLDSLPWPVPGWHETLSTGERARGERFCFPVDRRRFLTAQLALRYILGGYLKIEPGRLAFCRNAYGKPALSEATGGAFLRFNLSHSQGLALYAVAREREVGIDVEYVCSSLAGESIAEQFFSPQEVAALRALPRQAQVIAFFNCWTRKEAYIKAKGQGLSLALDQFDVSLVPGEPARLIETRPDPQEAERWTLREFAPCPGYVAALAVEGPVRTVTFWQWPGHDAW